MIRTALQIGLLSFTLCGCGNPNASDRAVQFTQISMKGEKIDVDEWFAPGVGDTDFMRLYGGAEKLSADSKKQADAEGGLKHIDVLKQESLADGVQLISIRATFNNGKTADFDETWKLIDGKWKLTPPGGSGAQAP